VNATQTAIIEAERDIYKENYNAKSEVHSSPQSKLWKLPDRFKKERKKEIARLKNGKTNFEIG